ncbi:hypothetical protein J6590_088194 [Homalodisca vitripennis]|nr:hypothetical protein J6590_088194 [Homalodisca vitripennis]
MNLSSRFSVLIRHPICHHGCSLTNYLLCVCEYLDVPVECLRISLGLPLLERRREIADLVLLHKIINGLIDCPDLLSVIDFRIPNITRSQDIFCRRAMSSVYAHHSCIPRMTRKGNIVNGGVEFFGSSSKSFRRSLHDFI